MAEKSCYNQTDSLLGVCILHICITQFSIDSQRGNMLGDVSAVFANSGSRKIYRWLKKTKAEAQLINVQKSLQQHC